MNAARVLTASLLVFVPIVGVACDGGGSSPLSADPDASTSVDGSQAPVPQAIFEGRLERGATNDCTDTGPLFTLGDFGNQAQSPSTAIKDGESFAQATVAVSCSVTPVGSAEFDVTASVALSGATGGFFQIAGKFTASGEQTGINATFSSRRSGNTYDQTDGACIVRYTTGLQGVAAGRVWGEITCPTATTPSTETACEAVAQFRFENCAQE
jgi:hypothetical protein